MEVAATTLVLVTFAHITVVSPQSNYASRGINTNYLDDGLPPEAVLNGTVTQLDTLSHAIYTNRTTATLSCATRAMDIQMEFKEPFFGIVYANFDRNAACSFLGNGSTKYDLQLPLQGCGTVQDPLRVFTNNIVVRFHPSLELEGDEIKTIVCRYPTPTVLPPSPVEQPILQPLPPVPETLPPAKLRGLEILLILCAILFLGLLLLGIACASYCVKRRNIKIVRTRKALSSGPGSDITKLSTDFGSIPFFPGLKIPRAHAIDTSDLEEIIDSGRGSQTLSSEYPSETHSNTEIEEGDARSCRQSTVDSVPIPSFRQTQVEVDVELQSEYSDHPPMSEYDMVGNLVKIPRVDPNFDVNVRIKRPPTVCSDTDSDFSVMETLKAQERYLTSILEREEKRLSDSEVSEHVARESQSKPLEGPILPLPKPTSGKKKKRPPSVFTLSHHSIPENDTWSFGETTDFNEVQSYHAPSIPPSEYPSEGREPSVFSEVPLARVAPPPKWNVKIKKQKRPPSERPESEDTETEVEDLIVPEEEKKTPPPKSASIKSVSEPQAISEYEPEMPIVPHYPNVTKHDADDLFKKNITENKTFEDEERLKRQTTEYYKKPKPQKPEFDVNIKRFPKPPSVKSESDTDWDHTSEFYPELVEPERPTETINYLLQPDRRSPPQAISPVAPEFDVKIKKHPRRPPTSIPDSETTIYELPEPEFDVKITKYARQPSRPATSIPDSISVIEEEPEPPKLEFDIKIKKHPKMPSRPATSIPDSVTTLNEEDILEKPDFGVLIKKHPKPPTEVSESDTDWDQVSDLHIHRSEVYRAIEDEERTTRRTTEYYKRPKLEQLPSESEPESPPPSVRDEPEKPDFNVKIKKHPKAPSRPATSIPDSVTTIDEPEPKPDFDVKIKRYPKPLSTRSESDTDWDQASDLHIQRTELYRVIEDEERHTRYTTEYYRRPKPESLPSPPRIASDHPSPSPPASPAQEQPIKPDFDVRIKRYPRPPTSISETTTSIEDFEYESHPPPLEPSLPQPLRSSRKPLRPDFDIRIKKHPRPPTSIAETTTTFDDFEYQPDQIPTKQSSPESPKEPLRPDFDIRIKKYPRPPTSIPETTTTFDDADDQPRRRPESPPYSPEVQLPGKPIKPDFDVRIKRHPRPPTSIPETTTTLDDVEFPPEETTENRRPNVRTERQLVPLSEYPDTVTAEWEEISDVRLHRTQTTRIYEDEERIRTQRTEIYRKPKRPAPLPPDWNVVIRKYPKPPSERPDSDTSDWDTISERGYPPPPEREYPLKQPSFHHPNWDVLIRVLEPPPEPDRDDRTSIFTVDDRQKWADLITTDTTFREIITEAIIEEDYDIIRRNTRYQRVFEPPKWDVIIRVLQNPPVINDDDRSTTTYSELPIRHRRRDGRYRPTQSRRTSLTSAPDADIRSIPEDVVMFARRPDPDAWSQSSGYTYKSSVYPRSMADRSQVGTEIVEVPFLNLDEVDSRSDVPRSSRYGKSVAPSLARSTSEFTENWVPHPKLFEVASDSEKSSNRNPKTQIFRRADSVASDE